MNSITFTMKDSVSRFANFVTIFLANTAISAIYYIIDLSFLNSYLFVYVRQTSGIAYVLAILVFAGNQS